MRRSVALVPTGTANLASMEAAFARAGATVERTLDPDRVRRAERVVLPGVGTLAAAMDRLVERDLDTALRERIEAGRPTLAVCVGMQALAATSEESPGTRGLGLWDAPVRRFPDDVRVPQLGWNRLRWDGAPEQAWAYFANSFALRETPGDDWTTAWAVHGVPFVAAARRGDVLACQFHPELSGAFGARLLEGWLAGAAP